MTILFKKTVLFALVVAVVMAGLPFVSASAAGVNDSTPPLGQISNERLEQVWARQLRLYKRVGKGFDRSDAFVKKVQQLIDRAKENGKDVSAVQAALDAFKAVAKDAKPIYESMKGIVNLHQGFDNNGKVTDPEKAKETVKVMGEELKEVREAMGGTGRALHEAIKAFRDANPRPEKMPKPSGDG